MKRTPKFWTDHAGRKWPTPKIKDRLRPHQIKGHAALKAFVICRDGGKCVKCGASENLVPDHIISRRNGGSHHPSNLQTLCKPCNDRKSNYEDRGREYPICGKLSESTGVELVCILQPGHVSFCVSVESA